jgi:hypothetical protein
MDPKELLIKLLSNCFYFDSDGTLQWSYKEDEGMPHPELEHEIKQFLHQEKIDIRS